MHASGTTGQICPFVYFSTQTRMGLRSRIFNTALPSDTKLSPPICLKQRCNERLLQASSRFDLLAVFPFWTRGVAPPNQVGCSQQPWRWCFGNRAKKKRRFLPVKYPEKITVTRRIETTIFCQKSNTARPRQRADSLILLGRCNTIPVFGHPTANLCRFL